MKHFKTWNNKTESEKLQYGPGPWQDEPDKAQWVDEETGLDCLIHRGPVGALCGYVGVPEGHPLHGKGYDEAYDRVKIEVHGGLTFANGCSHSEDPAKGICHIPVEGRPDTVWWLGFDCAHAWDYTPGSLHHWSDKEDVYRDFNYVVNECTKLAKQLASIETP